MGAPATSDKGVVGGYGRGVVVRKSLELVELVELDDKGVPISRMLTLGSNHEDVVCLRWRRHGKHIRYVLERVERWVEWWVEWWVAANPPRLLFQCFGSLFIGVSMCIDFV